LQVGDRVAVIHPGGNALFELTEMRGNDGAAASIPLDVRFLGALIARLQG
jgi:hypothetical protein